MATKTTLQNSLRKRYMDMVTEFLINQEEEVLQVASNEIALPCVDDEGNDEFIVLTFKIPKGSRDGDAYDGYEMAQDYEMKSKAKAEKQKKAQAEKSAKIERDAKEKASSIVADAEKRAANIEAESKKEADKLRADLEKEKEKAEAARANYEEARRKELEEKSRYENSARDYEAGLDYLKVKEAGIEDQIKRRVEAECTDLNNKFQSIRKQCNELASDNKKLNEDNFALKSKIAEINSQTIEQKEYENKELNASIEKLKKQLEEKSEGRLS